MSVVIKSIEHLERQCGDCQLCCKLLPIKEIAKPAGARCPHQRHHKGCMIYARRPTPCALWNCRWLVNDDTDDQMRPDRSHAVIDIMPDFIKLQDNASGETKKLPVVQIWIDSNFPDCHRAPALRAYIARRAQEGIAALIRIGSKRGFVVFAPVLSSDGAWHEMHSNELPEPEHTLADWGVS